MYKSPTYGWLKLRGNFHAVLRLVAPPIQKMPGFPQKKDPGNVTDTAEDRVRIVLRSESFFLK